VVIRGRQWVVLDRERIPSRTSLQSSVCQELTYIRPWPESRRMWSFVSSTAITTDYRTITHGENPRYQRMQRLTTRGADLLARPVSSSASNPPMWSAWFQIPAFAPRPYSNPRMGQVKDNRRVGGISWLHSNQEKRYRSAESRACLISAEPHVQCCHSSQGRSGSPT
jgi:hypothetical protein